MSVLGAQIRTLMERWGWLQADKPSLADDKLDEYVTSIPSYQNAIDALPGWNHAFPEHFGLQAGPVHLHNDPRILWAIEQYGSLEGRRILEIGPLEAAHTYMLDKHGPAVIDAVEANKLCYLRCLVTKEIMQIKSARFHLGDCQLWLEQRDESYDLIVASGVLYHMQNPVRFLEDVARRSDAVFIWTHYVDDQMMPVGDPRRSAFVGAPEIVQVGSQSVRMLPRSYHQAWRDKAFCGGMHDLHRWIYREDLLALLGVLGFDEIQIWGDQPDHPNGPAFSLLARRSPKPDASDLSAEPAPDA